MTETARCPDCGADNDVGVRRCRICAALLDAGAPETRPDSYPGSPAALGDRPPPPPGSAGAFPDAFDPLAVPGGADESFVPFDPTAPVDEPLSAEEIDRIAKEAVRNERLSRRPRLLRRVLDDPS